MAKTALSKSPSKKTASPTQGMERLSPGVYRNKSGQLVNSQGKRIDRSGNVVKGQDKKKTTKTPAEEARVTTGAGFATPFTEQTPEEQVGNIQTGVGQNVQNYLQQLQQQGAFQPGEYQDVYQQAYQNVMGQFNLQNQQAFQQQQQAVEQQIAERGIDPTGQAAKNLREQLFKQQEQARQGAMFQAENLGRQLQEQRFQQDLTRYQVPTQQLAALQGYFGGQLGSVEAQRQRDFEARQAELQRQASKDVARIGGGGGAKADPMALLAAEYQYKRDLLYDQAALAGQQQGGGAYNQALGGFAQGLGAGLSAGLMR